MEHPAPELGRTTAERGLDGELPFRLLSNGRSRPRPAPFAFLSQVGPLDRCANAPWSYMLKVYPCEIRRDKIGADLSEAPGKRWSAR